MKSAFRGLKRYRSSETEKFALQKSCITFVDLLDFMIQKINSEIEEKYRLLFENSSEAILLTDPHGGIYSANPQACILFQRNLEEICKIGREGIVDPNDKRLELAIKERARLGKFRGELNLKRKDGTIFPAEVSSNIFIDNGGNERTCMLIRDISLRRKAEELELEKINSEALYRSLFENSLMGISASDSDGRLIHANYAYAKMYGYDSPEQILEEVTDIENQLFAYPKDRQETLKILDKKGYLEPREFELVKRDKSRFHALVSVRKVFDTEGKFISYQASHIDITNYRQVKEELKQSKETLENLNKHLVDVREDERIKISRNIHDHLGQSMTALKIDLKWLKGNLEGNEMLACRIDLMVNIVNNAILDIQRMCSELRPEMLDDIGLTAVIEWYCDDFIKRTGLEVETEIDNIQSEDKSKNIAIFRILQESLTNVIRHAKASKVLISLRKIDNFMLFSVSDDGIGISTEKASSPFSFGILGMIERAKQSGGEIEISTELGKGVQIMVKIPL